ncbi:MAG: RsfS/YbeB/iojap family protein, partial [Selenomonadaceae bacterium]|nr:RsfS/YbeB/iojap family protein [Selenomonadaceae bacterium]
MTNREKEALVLARLAAQTLDEKKGEDVRVLDLRKVHGAPAEFFVIASGNVPSHVSA